ncbi:MAG TPA: hypothetical protein VJS66_06055 [Burkholderiales bacterium]|nr:hypothetical protein [Burkholderiales bacterium]
MAKKKSKKSKKTKSKKPKKTALKKTKKVKKKTAKKKTAVRKAKAKKSAAKAKPAMSIVKSTPAAIPGEDRIGVVTHYYNHLSVAIIKLETGTLRTGDTIHIKGHTSDFRQSVGSLEVDHVHVDQVQAGESFGLRVSEHAREHDVVYKAAKPQLS